MFTVWVWAAGSSARRLKTALWWIEIRGGSREAPVSARSDRSVGVGSVPRPLISSFKSDKTKKQKLVDASFFAS